MATPFSHTVRAFDADHFRFTIVLAPIFVLLFAAWTAWFCFAQITLYEVSLSARMRTASHVTAMFSAATLPYLRPGQQAHFRLESASGAPSEPIPATVVNINSNLRDGDIEVTLALQPDLPSTIPLQRGLTGSVEVETERVSPAVLILRTIGVRLSSSAPAR